MEEEVSHVAGNSEPWASFAPVMESRIVTGAPSRIAGRMSVTLAVLPWRPAAEHVPLVLV
jgi:hypothetical protein